MDIYTNEDVSEVAHPHLHKSEKDSLFYFFLISLSDPSFMGDNG